MLRFRCAACNKSLKVPEALAGQKVSCPRCHEPNRAPEPAQAAVAGPDDGPGFVAAMSPRLRGAVVVAAVGAFLGAFAFVWASFLGGEAWLGHAGLAVAGGSGLALLAMLHGHGTGCPACAAWWCRRQVKSDVAEREVFERDGATFARSVTRTEFRCDGCGHAWAETDAEEYPAPERGKSRRLHE